MQRRLSGGNHDLQRELRQLRKQSLELRGVRPVLRGRGMQRGHLRNHLSSGERAVQRKLCKYIDERQQLRGVQPSVWRWSGLCRRRVRRCLSCRNGVLQ